jgi:hypothetical protein
MRHFYADPHYHSSDRNLQLLDQDPPRIRCEPSRLHGDPPRLHCESPQLPTFQFDLVPDPASLIYANPDLASQNDADPDPHH